MVWLQLGCWQATSVRHRMSPLPRCMQFRLLVRITITLLTDQPHACTDSVAADIMALLCAHPSCPSWYVWHAQESTVCGHVTLHVAGHACHRGTLHRPLAANPLALRCGQAANGGALAWRAHVVAGVSASQRGKPPRGPHGRRIYWQQFGDSLADEVGGERVQDRESQAGPNHHGQCPLELWRSAHGVHVVVGAGARLQLLPVAARQHVYVNGLVKAPPRRRASGPWHVGHLGRNKREMPKGWWGPRFKHHRLGRLVHASMGQCRAGMLSRMWLGDGML